MSTDPMMTYYHVQRAPLCVLLYALAILFLNLAWVLQEPVPVFLYPIAGTLTLILAASFHYLIVADEGDRLAIRFGPLPLFARTVRYEDIRAVNIGRTTLLDGWGIHMSLRGGWVWNIWGRECVVLKLQKGILRVGTDDAVNLAQFVASRITPTSEG